ncbi:hypothetical protein JW930_00780 [Candidatus Woesearchaeota archaeon]|nr:hypothetical protein [Candidatus Woesearchaeota archaeon]
MGKKYSNYLLITLMLILAALPFLIQLPQIYLKNKTFLGFIDHPRYMAQAEFIRYRFIHPWATQDKGLIGDPNLGSTPLNLFIGFISILTGIDVVILVFLAQITGTFLFLYGAKKLIDAFDVENALYAFLLLILTPGIGGIARALFSKNHAVWVNIGTAYSPHESLAIGFGLLVISFLVKNQTIKSTLIATLMLSLSVLIHPTTGLILLGLSLVYLIIEKRKLSQFTIMIALLAAIPWMIFTRKYNGFSFGICDYVSVSNLVLHIGGWILNFGHLFLLSLIPFWRVYTKSEKGTIKLDFINLWIIVFLLFSLSPETKYAIMKDVYFYLLLTIPLSLRAAQGIRIIEENLFIPAQIILIILIIFSIPSLYYIYVVTDDKVNLFDEDVSNALIALREYPMGVAFGPIDIAHAIPVLGIKRTLWEENIIDIKGCNKLMTEYQEINDPNVSQKEKEKILKQYGVGYFITELSTRPYDSMKLLYNTERWYVYKVDLSN